MSHNLIVRQSMMDHLLDRLNLNILSNTIQLRARVNSLTDLSVSASPEMTKRDLAMSREDVDLSNHSDLDV